MKLRRNKRKTKWSYKRYDYLVRNSYGETDLDKLLDFSCGVFLKEKFEVSRRGKYEG